MLRPKLIRIRNIMGIEELEIEPGKVTVLEGGNATGKSSVLEAVKSIVEGGHDATLLRKGAEEGEAVIVLGDVGEDGSPGEHDGVEIRKRVTREKSDLKVTHPRFGNVSAPKGYVEGLLRAAAFNPVQFMTSDDRVRILLDALDPEVSAEDLELAVDPDAFPDLGLPCLIEEAAEKPALDAIEHLRSAIYDERTGVNRIAKEKRATAKQLTESLPSDGEDPKEIRAALEEAEDNLEEEREERAKRQRRAEEAWQKECEEIRSKRDARVEELQREIADVKNSAQEALDQATEERNRELEEIRTTFSEEIDQRRDLTTVLRERLRAAESAEGTRRNIREAEAAAEEHERRSETLSEALERLDRLKEKVLEDLPIGGAEIRDGELYVDGIPFERLNSQKRVEIAVEVAEMLAGDLGLVIVDDLELLDRDHFESLVARLEASPLTAIVTRVAQDGSPLRVKGSTE